ncbi:hypothetical protein HCN44_010117 [Aphidius gifuensis]|uniref:Odorant-binding protein n=1 Tax=Aphidius gifuensis TaxID=684658 RepID=A0A834XVU4_APHGI|nr:hypothetical protein HCN44_010117 [Aphidius gifuensis]
MSIQITVLLFVTITLLVASPINANSTRADYETTKDDYYSGNATTLGSTTIDSIINGTVASKKNGTILGSYYYNTSTTLQTPTGNFSTFNGTSVLNRNKTYTPSYYHTSTTLQAPTGNFSTINGTLVPKRNQTYYYTLTPNLSSAEPDTTTAQPQSTPSFGRYQVENNKTDDDEYNEKKAIMEKRLESLLERSQFPKFMNDPYGYNNTSNDTKDKFKPEITLEHRIEFEPQETTTATPDFSDNQMLNETINSTGKQYPNKFQVLFDLWLLDSGNGDVSIFILTLIF